MERRPSASSSTSCARSRMNKAPARPSKTGSSSTWTTDAASSLNTEAVGGTPTTSRRWRSVRKPAWPQVSVTTAACIGCLTPSLHLQRDYLIKSVIQRNYILLSASGYVALCVWVCFWQPLWCSRTSIFILKLNCHLGLEILLQSQSVDMWLKWNLASTLILHRSPGGILLMENMLKKETNNVASCSLLAIVI